MATKTKLTQPELMHVRNVVSAAYTYNNLKGMTLSTLAASFKVSRNTISLWLLEAVEKGYVKERNICENIKQKHIEEYERSISISNSCLRSAYDSAFSNRSHPDVELLAVI